ncbi:hypothetical protein Halha_1530 [Halobacteroides halobius DSM 5150]|uniref:Uncharacterized protein n=1 Tax=Halobacteroides halobius (strain ATCC 35273 / DSM 5150 / MD-1) TaxID=748449 RepID=L0K8X9_HALHC|nr:hypothetical protein [Halobacteroides halobius]AGB41471.1 hypothetical protein Halha_1530 [Halobacteroides halobius DSM 5150]
MNINWFKKHLIITLLIIISQLFLFYVNLKNNLLIFITILNLIGWLWLLKVRKIDEIKKAKYFMIFWIIMLFIIFPKIIMKCIILRKFEVSEFIPLFILLGVYFFGLFLDIKSYKKYS